MIPVDQYVSIKNAAGAGKKLYDVCDTPIGDKKK